MGTPYRTRIEADDATAKGFKSASDRMKAFDNQVARVGRVGGSRLNGITGGLRSITSAGAEASGGMAEVAGGAVGVGRAFGIAGIAIGVGVAVIGKATSATIGMANTMAKAGMEIRQTAGLIGIAQQDLQNLRGAGVFEGVDVEQTTASLKALSKVIRDAEMGENVEAQGLINRFKIVTKTRDGLYDTKEALLEIADVIARQRNPQTQEALAEKFGLTGLLPLLKQGRAGVEAAMARSGAAGANWTDEQTEAAKRHANALTDTDNRFKAMRKSFSEKFVLPWATPAIEKLGELFSWADRLMGGHSSPPSASPKTDVDPGKPGQPGGARGDPNATGRWDPFRGRWVWTPAPTAGRGGGGPPASTPGRGRNAWAMNNPGGIRPVGGGANSGYNRYATREAGLNAMAWQLKRYQNVYGLRTIEGIISRWAPRADPRNHTDAYIAQIAKRTGWNKDALLNLNDPATLAKLEEAMIERETGKRGLYSWDELLKSAGGQPQKVEVDVRFTNAPAGTTATVTQKGHKDDRRPLRFGEALAGGLF